MNSQNESTDLTTLFGADGTPASERLAQRLYWVDRESGDVLAIDFVCTESLARDLVAGGFDLSLEAARTAMGAGLIPSTALPRSCHGFEQGHPAAPYAASAADPARN